MPYPHVEILDRTESVALVLQILNVGELPVVFDNAGTKVQIAKVPLSALSIKQICRVSRVIWRHDQETEVELNTTDDIMSVLKEYINRRK